MALAGAKYPRTALIQLERHTAPSTARTSSSLSSNNRHNVNWKEQKLESNLLRPRIQTFTTSTPKGSRKRVYLKPRSWITEMEVADDIKYNKQVESYLGGRSPKNFVNSTSMQKYRNPHGRGPHWVGKTPFPANPSFNPPPPLAEKIKTEIYNRFLELTKPSENDKALPEDVALRKLSKEYSVSIVRLEAIIKLKVVAKTWVDNGIPLQNNFQTEMDRLLGAEDRTPRKINANNAEAADEPKAPLVYPKSETYMADETPSIYLPENLRGYLDASPEITPMDKRKPNKNKNESSRPTPLTHFPSRVGATPITITDITGTESGRLLEDTFAYHGDESEEDDTPMKGKEKSGKNEKPSGHPFTHPGPRNPLQTEPEYLPLPDHLKERRRQILEKKK